MATKKNVSETVTEGIFRSFYQNDSVSFIEKSAIPKSYGFKSKKGTKYKGYPDFFFDDASSEFVIVVEAKATDFKAAVKEVRYYSENNSITKDIIAIAIAGQTVSSYKAGLYVKLAGEKFKEIVTDGKLQSFADISQFFRIEKYGPIISNEQLKQTIKTLNETFHKYSIKDTERSLFFAGIMIALKDTTFQNTYGMQNPPSQEEQDASPTHLLECHNLNNLIIDAIVKQISTKVNSLSKEYNWKDRFAFIKNIDIPLVEYINVIRIVETKIYNSFRQNEKQDILGRAYKVFLSRAGKVDNKNIILTPDHIKNLMVELARLDVSDVVIDTCTGSGGFLMEAMEQMIAHAKGNTKTITKIMEHQLIGFETDPTLFALACSNMFLHGDGRTNLIYGSSLLEEGTPEFNSIVNMAPTKAIINPPYENNLPIQFTLKALQFLKPNGKLIVIMPTPTLNKNAGGMTKDILDIAKLDFVIKMPNNLFSEQQRTVNTSIFGFSKTAHDPNDKVLFYDMSDDGLVSIQHKGRVDKAGKWAGIREKVIKCVKYSEEVDAVYSKRTIYDKDEVLHCYGVKELKKGTNYVKIGDLFDKEKGSLASEDAIEGKYVFVTASEERKTHYIYSHKCKALVYAIAAAGSLGRCHYVDGKFIASNLCLILTPKKDSPYPVNLEFYCHYFNSMRKQIANELADGTSKLTIDATDLMEYEIEYFPIEKQNEIAALYRKQVVSLEKKLLRRKQAFEDTMTTLI